MPHSHGDTVSDILDLPSLAERLPPLPAANLDACLDAAARCFARHGVSRTTVPDVARELGVSRTTVYRQVGTVDELARLLFARELHRLLAVVPQRLGAETAVDAIVGVASLIVTYARQHPVLAKILDDEPEVAGSYLTTGLPDLVARVVPVVAPVLDRAAAEGAIARRDPEVLAEWLVRLITSLVLVPPRGGVQPFLDEVLRPVLTPAGSR